MAAFSSKFVKSETGTGKNQYPSTFYEPIIRDTIEKIMTKKEQQKEDDQQNVYRVKMQYRGFATEQFVKKLKGVVLQ